MNAELKEKLANIDRTFDAAKEICKTIAPLSDRAQRRLLTYFMDLVTDPHVNGPMDEAKEILALVHKNLGIPMERGPV